MTDCNDMKVGDIYTCPDCGLGVQIIKGLYTTSPLESVHPRVRGIGAGSGFYVLLLNQSVRMDEATQIPEYYIDKVSK